MKTLAFATVLLRKNSESILFHSLEYIIKQQTLDI